jgi:hypothetical protein
MAQYRHLLRGYVEINGIARPIAGATATSGPDVQVATAQVQLDPRQTTPFLKDRVVLYGGTNSAPVPIFVGEVGPVGLAYFPQTGQITCQGPLDRARIALGIAAGEPLEDIDGNPLPAAAFGTASEGGVAVTDGSAVKLMLDLVGVPYDDDSWEEAGWPMGEVLPLTIMRGQDVLGAIEAIDRVTHCVTYDGRDGRARRVRIALPVAVPNLVYQQGVNIESIQRQIGDRKIINRINITGLASDLFTVSDTVEDDPPTSPTTGLPLVPTPPGFQSMDFQSDLLETAEQLLEFGTTELGQVNRPEESYSLGLPVINPALSGGESIQIFAPAVGMGVDQVGRVGRVSHRLAADSFKTDLSVRMSYAGMGTGTNVKPVPSFVYKVLRKQIASLETLWVIACDASGSTDPDGAYEIPPHTNEVGQEVVGVSHNGIALYQWESSFGPPASVSDGGKRCTFVTTEHPEGETITLTVYDYQGASASVTQTIVFTDQQRFLVRDVWAAIEQALLFSSDGERTWNRIEIPAVGCARFAADTFQLAWEASGTCYKVLVDLSFVAIDGPTNVTAGWITWVYPATEVPGLRCWLGCANGDIYFSGDHGETWEYKATLEGGAPVTSIQESAFAENQCYATAGRQLFQTFDGVAWTEIYAHPNTGLIAAGFESGFDVGLVVYHGEPPAEDPGAEATRIRERFNTIQGDWVRQEELFDLAAGTWRVAYSYQGAGGETNLSPHQDVVIAGTGSVARIAPLDPLPPGATGVYYYASLLPGGIILRRFAEGTGFLAVDLDAPAPVGGQLPPTENTTLQNVADPTDAPVVVTAAAASEAPVDFPADPQALTIGLTVPVVHVAGRSQDDTFQIWSAPIDADFTLQRATYDQDFGLPKDIVRDGAFEDVVIGAAEDCLFQTVDGFRTTIYMTLGLLGSDHGLKIGLGALHAILVRGNLIWVGGAVDGRATSLNLWVYRLTADGFERTAHPLSGDAGAGTLSLQNIALVATSGGALITYGHIGRGPTHANAYRSTDGGETWDAITDFTNPKEVRPGPAGVVYASTAVSIADGFAGAALWRSDDDGATWTQVHTRGPSGVIATTYNAIATDPTDPLRIVVKGFWNQSDSSESNPRALRFHLSEDGGVTFTNLLIDPDDQAGAGGGQYAALSPDSGHILWFKQESFFSPIQRAEVAVSATVTDATTPRDGADAQPTIINEGTIYMYGATGVQASADQGATWSIELDADNSLLDPTDHNIQSFVPGDAVNDWYALPGNAGAFVGLIKRAAGSVAGADWTDLSPQLFAAFPDTEYYAFREAAVRLDEEEA